ncbi:MAG: SDR family NAD(P)-dependent oxidoreductase [Lachnospiraceae bacterium]
MLKGKTVLITGAGGGIGRACAVMMAHEHAQVFITGRREEPLKETAQMITEQGGVCDYCCCDVSKEKEVEALLQAVIRRYGRLDTLVNNAAVFLQTDIRSPELEDSWQQLLDVNVMGMVKVIHAALPYLIENGSGSIINLSSIDAFSGCLKYTGYSAAKGAVVSLTRGLALELGQYDIRVNAVAPGITDTPMTHERIESGREKYLARLALKRIGRDEDIAGAVLFLASDLSTYITGEVLNVNGGMQFV